jgi:uncharacterized protein (DUF1499 family)
MFGSLAIVFMMVGPVLANLQLARSYTGFTISLAGAGLALAGLLLGIIAAMRGGGSAAVLAIGLAAIVSFPVFGFALWARRYPVINDLTTDTKNPPRFVHIATAPDSREADYSYPASFADVQQTGYPEISPLALPLSPGVAFEIVDHTAKQMTQWVITVSDGHSLTLEGFQDSVLFRFRDDFVIEVRRSGIGSAVHMRSRSRVGKSDLGVNARRIGLFLEAVQYQADR